MPPEVLDSLKNNKEALNKTTESMKIYK
jgi:hypothetical protein